MEEKQALEEEVLLEKLIMENSSGKKIRKFKIKRVKQKLREFCAQLVKEKKRQKLVGQFLDGGMLFRRKIPCFSCAFNVAWSAFRQASSRILERKRERKSRKPTRLALLRLRS